MSKPSIIMRAGAITLAAILSLPMTGCGPFGGGGSKSENVTYVYSQSVQVALGAENRICNDSVGLTINGIQKRPITTFADADVIFDTADNEGISESLNNSLALEIDMDVTFNSHTFEDVTRAAGSEENPPKKMIDILRPGSLIFIRGTDPNGGKYSSYAIIQPDDDMNPNQAIANSQWNYNILDATLPEASESISGSLLFKISSRAKDLQLVIFTANNNPSPLDEQAVMSGNNKALILDIDTIS